MGVGYRSNDDMSGFANLLKASELQRERGRDMLALARASGDPNKMAEAFNLINDTKASWLGKKLLGSEDVWNPSDFEVLNPAYNKKKAGLLGMIKPGQELTPDEGKNAAIAAANYQMMKQGDYGKGQGFYDASQYTTLGKGGNIVPKDARQGALEEMGLADAQPINAAKNLSEMVAAEKSQASAYDKMVNKGWQDAKYAAAQDELGTMEDTKRLKGTADDMRAQLNDWFQAEMKRARTPYEKAEIINKYRNTDENILNKFGWDKKYKDDAGMFMPSRGGGRGKTMKYQIAVPGLGMQYIEAGSEDAARNKAYKRFKNEFGGNFRNALSAKMVPAGTGGMDEDIKIILDKARAISGSLLSDDARNYLISKGVIPKDSGPDVYRKFIAEAEKSFGKGLVSGADTAGDKYKGKFY